MNKHAGHRSLYMLLAFAAFTAASGLAEAQTATSDPVTATCSEGGPRAARPGA